ncbi:uncharacterized protein LOC144902173 isoform X2 [Branchiostoma floridae x Branchiostoma belcheri]
MMESNSWEDKLTCTWRSEGQLDITGFPEDMPMCLQYYLSSIKAEKWPRALNLIQEGEGHCFLSGTGISFPRDYESSSSDEEGPRRGPLPEDEVEFFAGRFPKNRLKRLLFLRTVMKCLSKRRETHGPIDGEQQFLDYLEEEERRSKLATKLAESGSPKESLSSKSFLKGKRVEVPQSEPMELEETKRMKTDVHEDTAVEERIDDESRFIPKAEKDPALDSHVDIQDLITNNYDLLKENINAIKVFRHMIHKRVLEDSDHDEIFRPFIPKSDYAESEALLDMLSRRRSCPPALFLDILRIEHPDIVDRLSTEVSSPKAIISRQKDNTGPFYRMTHKPRGTALIITDEYAETSKTKEDSELLTDAFKSLHFATKTVRDLDFDLSSAMQPGGIVDQDCNVFCFISERPHRVMHEIGMYQSLNDKPTLIFCHTPARFRPNPMSMYRFMKVLDTLSEARDDDKDCYLSLSNSPNYTRTLAKTLLEYGKSDDFESMMLKVYSACDDFHCHNRLRKRLYFPP